MLQSSKRTLAVYATYSAFDKRTTMLLKAATTPQTAAATRKYPA